MCWQFIRPHTPVRLSDGRPPLLVHLVCVPRAASTSPGSSDRSPRVFTRHHLGPPTGHRRACPRRLGERRTQCSHSIVARNTSGAPHLESPGVRERRWLRELFAPTKRYRCVTAEGGVDVE